MLDCAKRFASRMADPKNRKSPLLTAKVLRLRIMRAAVDTTREKKVKGRKRHILVDTLGLILVCIVHAANVQDRDGAKWVLARATFDFMRLRIVRADGGYAGKLVNWTKQNCRWAVEIIRRTSPGFIVLPKRWVVESPTSTRWLRFCTPSGRDSPRPRWSRLTCGRRWSTSEARTS